MTLQASGSISIANIATEFGGSAPHSLSEYYKGTTGALVRTDRDVGLTNIPASGVNKISNYYGAQKGIISYTNSRTVSNSGISGTERHIGLFILSDGTIQKWNVGQTLTSIAETWSNLATIPDITKVNAKMTATNGTMATGPTWWGSISSGVAFQPGTGTGVSFSKTTPAGGPYTATVQIKIWYTFDTEPAYSGNWTLSLTLT